MDVNKDVCDKHWIPYSTCQSGGCKTLNFCKYCCVYDRNKLKHLHEHFDHIILKEDSSCFKEQIKLNDEFIELNKIYQQYINQANNFASNALQNLINTRAHISDKLKGALTKKYNVTKAQKVQDTQQIKKGFDSLTNIVEKKFLNMKVSEMVSGINFNLSRDCEWIGFNSNRITTESDRGLSYWHVRSKEILEGPFEAKLDIINIDKNSADTYWNYTFGIIKAESKKTDEYFDDSIVLHCNGFVTDKFGGKEDPTQSTEMWATGDSLFIKRDTSNNIYFALNDENNYKLAFEDVCGNFQLMLGFATFLKGDTFELKEIYDI